MLMNEFMLHEFTDQKTEPLPILVGFDSEIAFALVEIDSDFYAATPGVGIKPALHAVAFILECIAIVYGDIGIKGFESSIQSRDYFLFGVTPHDFRSN
jgi:hypothetical protein